MNLDNVSASTPLALSDGTPVEFVKITSKDRLQVRIPADHPLGADDPLRIFGRDGRHYKGATELTLVATVAAPAAPEPASNDNSTYIVGDNRFDNLDDARNEAIDLFSDDPTTNVEIIAVSRKVIGVVGFVADPLAA